MTVRSPTEEFFRALYEAFNARDIDKVIASTHPDVNWPNMIEGGREHGHAAVREYWRKQFESTDPRVEPERVTSLGDQILVEVRQVVKDRAGTVLSEGKVEHLYVLRDDLIERMDVREG